MIQITIEISDVKKSLEFHSKFLNADDVVINYGEYSGKFQIVESSFNVGVGESFGKFILISHDH